RPLLGLAPARDRCGGRLPAAPGRPGAGEGAWTGGDRQDGDPQPLALGGRGPPAVDAPGPRRRARRPSRAAEPTRRARALPRPMASGGPLRGAQRPRSTPVSEGNGAVGGAATSEGAAPPLSPETRPSAVRLPAERRDHRIHAPLDARERPFELLGG